MTGRNFIVKSAEKFSEHDTKNSLENSLHYRKIVKKPKIFHSVMIMTSMTMLTPKQNLSNLQLVKSPPNYAQIRQLMTQSV